MQVEGVTGSYSYPINPSQVKKPAIDKTSELYKACQDFETLFIKQMLDSMRKTLNTKDELIGTGTGQDMYNDMLYDEYAKKMSSTGQFGIADMIYQQVSSKL
jgi:peptidoglycan hydrolase FlgJ